MPKELDIVGFHLEELRLYRAKLEEHIKEVRQSELYSITGMFAFYAWIASRDKPVESWAVWYLPALIPIILFVKDKAHGARIKAIADYILKLEDVFVNEAEKQGAPHAEGFEHYFPQVAGHKDRFKVFAYAFYTLLALIAMMAPLLMRPKPPDPALGRAQPATTVKGTFEAQVGGPVR